MFLASSWFGSHDTITQNWQMGSSCQQGGHHKKLVCYSFRLGQHPRHVPAFSTALVYLCIIIGTCTSVFRSVAKSWYLINVAILMHTKEHPPQISPQKKTYCPMISSTCHGWPPAQWLPKPSTTHQEEGGIGDPTNTLARISWDSSVSLVFPQGRFPLWFSCETTHGEKSFRLVTCME